MWIRFYLFLLTVLLLGACKDKEAVNTQEPKEMDQLDNSTSQVKKKKNILFFGDSLTAGYGLEDGESYPDLIREWIDSLGLDYTVINGGLSGETSAGGLGRIDWVLQQPVDIFILELGANDVLRGLDLGETRKNLTEIIESLKAKYPEAKLILAGMQAPPNMGQAYTREFASIFPDLARQYNGGLIPFLLENVAAIPELNLSDGKHPNARGQYIVRDNVWRVLKDYL